MRGGAGFRSLCLPIANRPLYRVSYTPMTDVILTKSRVQAMGFEPMPLSRLAPKASALTTRPNLLSYLGGPARSPLQPTPKKKTKKIYSSPRGDSNPQPPDPKSDALSIAPLGRYVLTKTKMSTRVGYEPTQIGRAHVRTPVTEKSRMPSSA